MSTENKMKDYSPEITGHLDIFVADNEDDSDSEVIKWRDVMIHGDPEGLRSFAKLLLKLADLNQDEVPGLPDEAREHIHLSPMLTYPKAQTRLLSAVLMQREPGNSILDIFLKSSETYALLRCCQRKLYSQIL